MSGAAALAHVGAPIGGFDAVAADLRQGEPVDLLRRVSAFRGPVAKRGSEPVGHGAEFKPEHHLAHRIVSLHAALLRRKLCVVVFLARSDDRPPLSPTRRAPSCPPRRCTAAGCAPTRICTRTPIAVHHGGRRRGPLHRDPCRPRPGRRARQWMPSHPTFPAPEEDGDSVHLRPRCCLTLDGRKAKVRNWQRAIGAGHA